jgi:hypothetical protein
MGYLNHYKDRVGMQARNVTDEQSRINGLEERLDQFVGTITETQNHIFGRLEELNHLIKGHPESDKRTRSDEEDEEDGYAGLVRTKNSKTIG